jgi:hypothetical protein
MLVVRVVYWKSSAFQLAHRKGGGSMRAAGKLILAMVLAAFAVPAVGAQSVSQRQEIAVFNLGYYRWSIPPSALGAIDEGIRGVLINLGRFDVIGMAYRFDEEDVQGFIDAIRSFKEQNLEIPESVQMGREYLTQADVTRLVSGFVVVIPAVVEYRSRRDGDAWKVDIRTSFTFIDVAEGRSFAQFFVATAGSDGQEDRAVRKAVDAIPARLTFEVRRIDRFTLRTGILEVHGREVVIELGSRMGVKAGDEYLVLSPRVLSSGREVVTEKGLIVVKRVEAEISYATVLFADGGLEPGEQLRELPRVGMETEVYGRGMIAGTWMDQRPFALGIRVSATRGFPAFRPFIEVEVPFELADEVWGIPLNALLGAEYGFDAGRLRLAPFAAAGVSLDLRIEEGEVPGVLNVGGTVGCRASWLIARSFRLGMEAGVVGWKNVSAQPWLGSVGVFAGAGIVVKY